LTFSQKDELVRIAEQMAKKAASLLIPLVVGLAAGTVGTFFVLWAQGRNPANVTAIVATVALAITVVGWYKSTQLQAVSQTHLLHLKLLTEGRGVLVKALHLEADRMRTCSIRLHVLRFSDPVTDELRANVAQTFRHALGFQGATDWIFALEEHEGLFPEVRIARIQLSLRMRKIHDELRRYADLLTHQGALPRQFDAWAEEFTSDLDDQVAMLSDLAIHIQNRAFEAVSGHRANERRPPDNRVPRLVMSDGQLVMHVPDETRRVQMEVAGWLPPRNPPGS
jgi:hypothetical protein